MDSAQFKRVYKRTMLSKAELALLYGVTRQTIYNWINGGEPTQGFVLKHAEEMTRILNAMLDKQLLPFSKALTKERRIERLKKVLTQVHRIAIPEHWG